LHELQANKLVEEAKEYRQSNSAEELADILELIDELLSFHNISFDQLRVMQKEKRTERGGYEDRVVLDWIREE
jgi:predicted house-cleaning noncanonical NTP pyrophosphatase (MazG superfamily)